MRILISRTDKIGDLVLSIPSFNAISQMYPGAQIYCLVRKYNADIVRNLPYIADTIVKDEHSEQELIEKLKSLKLDVFIALYSDSEVAKLAKASGAKKRIGPYSKLNSFFAFNEGIRQKRSQAIKNEAEYNLDLVKQLDSAKFKSIKKIDSQIYIDEAYRDKIKHWLKQREIHRYIVVHPLSGGSAKNLSKDQYVSLIESFVKMYPMYSVVVSGSESDGTEILTMLETIHSDRVFAFISSESIQYLSALIEKSELYIGSSTGPTHIAGSLGKKIIAIYPKIQVQSKVRWGIYDNRRVIYIEPRENCEEKYKCRESCKDFDCFEHIQMGEIMAKIAMILGE